MKSFFKITAMAMLILMLAGCNDAAEPDTLGYVVAIGIDKAKEDKKGYDITLQFANPSKISGGSSEDGGEGGNESIDNITVTAPGIYPAVNIANHIISKRFVLSHTKLIVFSREICEGGLENLLETIGRSSDIRPNIYFAMSEDSAKDFLEAVNPQTEVNPVRYYTMIFENDYSGFIPQNMARDFFFYYNSDEKAVVMPTCASKSKKGTQKYSDTGYQYNLEDYKAGEIELDKDETQVMGMAVFDKDKQVGEMGDIQTEIYNMLTGGYKSSYVSYYYSKTPDSPVTLVQKQRKHPKIKVDTSGDAPKIKVKVFIEGDFLSSTPRESVEKDIDAFCDEATEEIKKEIVEFLGKTQEMGTDIVGFGSYAKRNFKTLKEFSNYKWKEKYKNAEFDVEVDFAVRRTGLVIRSDKR